MPATCSNVWSKVRAHIEWSKVRAHVERHAEHLVHAERFV
jgi:hypothetical protein